MSVKNNVVVWRSTSGVLATECRLQQAGGVPVWKSAERHSEESVLGGRCVGEHQSGDHHFRAITGSAGNLFLGAAGKSLC